MEVLKLDSAPEVEQLNLNQQSSVVNPESVKEKTDRFKFINPSGDPISAEYHYAQGEDEQVDQIVGSQIAQADHARKTQFVEELIANPDPEVSGAVFNVKFPSFEEYSKNAVVRQYAKTVANTVASQLEDLDINQPDDAAFEAIDIAERQINVVTHIRDRALKEQQLWDEKTFGGKVGSFVWQMIPLLDAFGSSEAIDNIQTSSWLKGSNIREQAAWLHLQDPEDIPELLDEAIEDVRFVAGDLAALDFANYMLGISSSDAFIEDVFAGADIALTVAPAALKVAKLGKSTVKSVAKFGTKADDIVDDLGETELAVVKKFVEKETLNKAPESAKDVEHLIPGSMNVDHIMGKVSSKSSAAHRKLRDAALYRSTIAERILKEGQTIDTLTQEELAKLVADEMDNIKKFYVAKEDAIRGYNVVRAEDSFDNVDKLVVDFGNMNGAAFKTEQAAKSWAGRHLKFADTEIVQEGTKYIIRASKPVKNDIEVLGGLVDPDQITPNHWLKLIHSDGLVAARSHVADKRTITDISELTANLMEEMAQPIANIGSKKRFNEFELSIKDAIVTGKKQSRRWQTLNEWERSFKSMHSKAPTDAQRDAYVAMRQISDFDYVARDLTAAKQKMRLGAQNWSVKGIDESFEGVQRKDIPFGHEDFFRIAVLDDNGKILKKGNNASKSEDFKEFLDDNYMIIQPFTGSTKIKDTSYTFILTRTGKSSNIKMGQSIGYNPGGHQIMRSPFYIKQGKISVGKNGSRTYTGDNTIWSIFTRGQGDEIVKKLEEARRIKKENPDAFAAYIRDNFPEMTKKDIKRIDWDQEFMVTRSGQRVNYKKGVHYDRNMVDNSFNLSNELNGRFAGERGNIVDAIYSERNSDVIRIEQGQTIKPVKALEVGMRDALDQHIMTDFVMKQAATIKREFGHILDDSDNLMQRDPLAFLTNPKFGSNATDAEKKIVKRLANAMTDFMKTPSWQQEALQSTKERIVEWAVGKFGKDSKITDLVQEHLVHTVQDPGSFFRAIAFHTKLGLFNPKQLWLQSQILTQVASVGGVRATGKAIPALMYSRALWKNGNPQMLEDAAKRMTKFGWKAEHFRESHEALSKSGWDIIGTSVASRDVYEGPKIATGVWGKFLDTGTLPFKTGEKIGRVTAWHVAYQNWRKANPRAVFDRKAISEVRLRASDLTANMTRDMNAQWQRGFLAVPTQFWGFQARVWEQMTSSASRLTKVEKARLFAGTSLMYGVPVGIGAGTQFLPLDEIVKASLMENGMEEQVENSVLLETIRDGILATSIEMISGMDFDTGDFGPAGNPAVRDLYTGESNFFEVLGGASGNITADIIGSVVPLVRGSYYAIAGDDDPANPWALTLEDVMDTFKEVSSVNNVMRYQKVLNTGQWITGNENVIADVSKKEAFIHALTGLIPEEVSDGFLVNKVSKDIRKEKLNNMRDVQKNYQRARQAAERGDWDDYEMYVKRAKSLAVVHGLNIRESGRAYTRGFSPETLSESARENLEKQLRDREMRNR